jgi:hypothetical protein
MGWSRLRVKVFFVAAMVAAGGGARAAQIRYTITGTGAVLIGNTSFSNVPFTAIFTGDTANVVNTANSSVATSFTSIEYASSGNFDVFSLNPATIVLTNDFLGDRILVTSQTGQINFYPANSPLVNFQLQNAIGPQSIGFAGGITDFITNGLRIEITGNTNTNGTFASTLAIPEPSTLVVAGIASLMGLGYAWLHRRKTTAA